MGIAIVIDSGRQAAVPFSAMVVACTSGRAPSNCSTPRQENSLFAAEAGVSHPALGKECSLTYPPGVQIASDGPEEVIGH